MSFKEKMVSVPLKHAFSKILEILEYPETQVIFSHQNGLEPNASYGVINILGVDQVGFRSEATFLLDEGDILETVTHYKLQVQISFVGTATSDIAQAFRHGMVNDRRCFETLLRANFGILDRGQIRRIPQKRESDWVDAYNMDFSFSFAVNTRFTYDWIEYVDFEGIVIHREPNLN